MQKKIHFLPLFILMLTFFSCGSKPGTTDSEIPVDTVPLVVKQDLPVGKITDNIVCTMDDRFSYALYLPKNYNEEEEYPLLFLFDAHAKGKLPLEKYKDIADEFGYILACSNTSKNSLAMGLYEEIKITSVADIRQKCKVDAQRIYLGGFSGGARVAANLGVADPSIAGIICNSAGFEPSAGKLRNNLAIVGLAGKEDFNWMEQWKTENSLDPYPLRHALIEFEGKHDWAPVDAMKQALTFIDYAAMVVGKKKVKNMTALNTAYFRDVEILNSCKKKSEKYLQLKKLKAFYDGSLVSKDFTGPLEKMAGDAEVKKFILTSEKALEEEAAQQSVFYQKIFSEDLPWWETEIKKMNAAPKGTERYRTNKRLLSYLSLMVYMTANSPQAKADDFVSEKFILLYSMVDPENPEWAYMSAVLKAKQGNVKAAVDFFKQAVALGFEDRERAITQEEFGGKIAINELETMMAE